jgi:predicted ATPase
MGSSGTAVSCQASGANRPVALPARDLRDWPAAPSQSGEDRLASRDRLNFGRFSLLPTRRLLLQDSTPVHIGGRALDLLIALTARAGELVTKEELLAQVWPDTFVEEVNLRVHMTTLRKALGDSDSRLICTVPGRGYQFVAPVSRAVTPPSRPSVAVASSRLPASASARIIGRNGFIDSVVAELPQRRLITVVGPGGIGKTTVAVACSEALAGSYRDGAGFVDLAPVTKPEEVNAAVATVLGIAVGSTDPTRDLMQHLQKREMLLVIDNCEHVIDAAAELIEAIVGGAPRVHILATSRESLRVSGEWVRNLPPLPSPPEADDLTAAEAMSYPAVQLFVERAAAAQQGFQLSDATAPIVGEICRRLDGVALAIELAAAQADVFGLEWLVEHLDERLSIFNRGRRTAAPRHQTLSAMLDWSYRLLSEEERATLQRVAVFAGTFTLEAAIAVAAGDGICEVQVADAVGGLVSKSLATSDISGSVTQYRLPETTRAYACAKLKASVPFPVIAVDHAPKQIVYPHRVRRYEAGAA